MEYISREDYCEENCGKENREGYKTCKNCSMLNIPSTDVQPMKHGKWIDIYEWCKMHNSKPSGIGFYYWCSNCGKCVNHRTNNCCECGAKMDSDNDKDNNVRNLTDEETAIFESWLESEAIDTGENIMDGDAE